MADGQYPGLIPTQPVNLGQLHAHYGVAITTRTLATKNEEIELVMAGLSSLSYISYILYLSHSNPEVPVEDSLTPPIRRAKIDDKRGLGRWYREEHQSQKGVCEDSIIHKRDDPVRLQQPERATGVNTAPTQRHSKRREKRNVIL